jgi:prevent-host-death family protein
MATRQSRGVEEARKELPRLLEAAEKGRSTVITRHGKPVAALVPIADCIDNASQHSLASVAGTGRGLWGSDSRRTVARLRGEWDR